MEGLDGFGGNGQQAMLGTFPADADLPLRELEVFELEIENLMGAEAIQQHQGHQSEIPKSAKAAPELGHLVAGERHNHPPWLAELDRFWEKEQTKGEVETLILDHVYMSLPTPPFTDDDKKLVAQNVYSHIWQQAVGGTFAAAV